MWTGFSLLGDAAGPTDGRWQRGTGARGRYLADEAATAAAIASGVASWLSSGCRPAGAFRTTTMRGGSISNSRTSVPASASHE
jgi:hypothetical protein